MGLLIATPAIEAELYARVADDLASVELELSYAVPGAGPVIDLALPADRYREIPENLRPSELREAFVSELSTGGFEDLRVEIDGALQAGGVRHQQLGEPYLEIQRTRSGPARIVVRTTLRVPERYGGFGRVGRALTLGGGWFPKLARPGQAPPELAIRATLDFPAGSSLVFGSSYVPSRGEDGRRVVKLSRVGPDAALILRPASDRVLSFAEGRARFLTGPASQVQDGEGLPVLARELRKAVEDGLAFLPRMPGAERGAFTAADPLVLVEAPLRHELALAVHGVVLVSDRAFRMIEVDRFLRFHRFPILKEVFGLAYARAGGADPPGFRAAFLGTWAIDHYVAYAFGFAEDAFDVLSIVSFIPSVDLMLYSPDLPFMSAYFRSTPADDPLAVDLVDAPLGQPYGQRLFAKLIDRFGISAAHAIAEEVAGGVPIASAAGARFRDPEERRRFFATWLGPYPSVAYVLTDFGERAPGQAFATIERRGDVVSEPITVRFVDEEGGARDIVASATTAALRTVTATLAAALDRVEIDPYGRLTETPQPDLPSPRFLHRSRPRWKFLLNNFAILFAATEASIDTALDVGLARVYDPRWSFGARAEYAKDAITGSLRATYSFGELVTPARLAWFAGIFLDGAYLRPGFAGVKDGGGAISAGASLGYDDRQSAWAPESGTGLRLGVEYQRILGQTQDGLTQDAVDVSLRAVRQWRIGARQQLTVRAAIAGYLAGEPQKQQLFSLGGRTGIRGYATDAALGRFRALLSAEWLHPLLPKMDLDGFYIAWVTGLDGALFGDVGVVGDDLPQAFAGPVFGDVGYALRLYIEYFGVRPGVLAVDVALPLVKVRDATQLGPPAVYIAFSQSFFVF
ncbi:MAG: hypothetical protein U1E65_12320 [Myxococcota bacterium]